MAKRERRRDVALEAGCSLDVRGVNNGRREEPSRTSPRGAPYTRRVEIEHLQTLVDPARAGDRAAATPARAYGRLAAERE